MQLGVWGFFSKAFSAFFGVEKFFAHPVFGYR
jgi:hypothetical protein